MVNIVVLVSGDRPEIIILVGKDALLGDLFLFPHVLVASHIKLMYCIFSAFPTLSQLHPHVFH